MAKLALVGLICVVLLFGSTTLWGQAGTSTIRGEVEDPQGAVVSGATVTITSTTTGYTRTQPTTERGAFSFELIPPGEYRLDVTASGFDTATQSVRALVGTPSDVHVVLALGTKTEIVDVSATEVQVNTQDATLGNNFIEQQITQLPMEARDVTTLLTLQPGVTRNGYVAGARSDQSNITLDGVDINEAQSNSLEKPVLRLNSEAIEEFRVTTVNPNANQGRSSAAQVNLITKSGTNELHGSAFLYNRDTRFTANDWFNNYDNVERPDLIRNTFGASLGGPIKKKVLFFFYSFEGRRDRSQQSVTRDVPLAHLGEGIVRVDVGGGETRDLTPIELEKIFPEVGLNPYAMALLGEAARRYPANSPGTGDGLNIGGYRFNAKAPVSLNSHVAKFDWNISSTQSAFIRANNIYDSTSRLPWFPDTPGAKMWEHPWGLAASHTWAARSNLVNNFRYGFTRQAFTDEGDSQENAVYFRYIFSPFEYTRTLHRETPVHNFTDDISWVKNNHTVQFGTNVRVIRNNRVAYGGAYDRAIVNPSYYASSGAVVSDPIMDYLFNTYGEVLASEAAAQDAASALIGRFSQYEVNYTFDLDGNLQPLGTPTERHFATEEYDWYAQDAWQIKRNLTLTVGLRYGLSRPVRETQGYEAKPDIPLQQYFQSRLEGMYNGTPYYEPISVELSGAANGKSNLYNWDTNNFQPRVSLAWSPGFTSGPLAAIFGGPGKSAVRTGFAITNDYFGQALAVQYDLNNTLGFVLNYTTPPNSFDVTDYPGPQFTGVNTNVRGFEHNLPSVQTWPQLQASDMERRIETSLDEKLNAPVNYMWNLTVERELPAGFVAQASYIGRLGRNLIASRDVMAPNNVRDPQSGMDWYTAATTLEKMRQQGAPMSSVEPIPYFENLWPNLAETFYNWYEDPGMQGLSTTELMYYLVSNEGWAFGNDWTYLQHMIDRRTGTPWFFQPQYGAMSAIGTIGKSNYHGLTLSLRQRYGKNVSWDFNYTWSHSLDDASGLQSNFDLYDTAFILNPIRQSDNYADSDFDIRHMINVNGVFGLPFGHGQRWANGVGKVGDAIIGGWQLSTIFRWNTGLPMAAPYDDARWATNWNAQSWVTRTREVEPCVSKGSADSRPKYFGCNTTEAYHSFRNAYPGETGERNPFRMPSYVSLDMGLGKTFAMPAEGHSLQFRWEVFNVTNTQRFGAIDRGRSGFGLGLDPALNGDAPPKSWSNFTEIQGTPRVMQFGLRYEF